MGDGFVKKGLYQDLEDKVYCTMYLSEPFDFVELKAIPVEERDIPTEYMLYTHSETNKKSVSAFYKGRWVHDSMVSRDTLVMYKSLDDDNGIYAKPLQLFSRDLNETKSLRLVGGLYNKGV